MQEYLTARGDGAFVVRDSPACFATITMMHKGRFYQSQLEDTPDGMFTPSTISCPRGQGCI